MSSISVSAPHNSAIGHATGHVARTLTLVYGVVSYLAFLVAFVYAIGFVENWFVPKSLDTGRPGPVAAAMLVNAALLGLFVLQHTIMARPAFKRWWTRWVPRPIERSTYVLAASACLGLLYWQWRPLPQVIWNVTGPAAPALTAVSVSGWLVALAATCLISHMDLFGLRQAWLRFRNRPYTPVGFRLVGLYRVVRHPLMLGFLIAFWATPRMTLGHLFFAALTTGYILFGTWMEERDLVAEHGERYRAYRRSVRGLVPIPRRADTPAAGR
jgi:methanethiol S-methyltransferase